MLATLACSLNDSILPPANAVPVKTLSAVPPLTYALNPVPSSVVVNPASVYNSTVLAVTLFA